MKAKDIAKQYGVDGGAFSAWVKTSGASYKSGAMGGLDIDDGQDIGALVATFKGYQMQEQQRLDDQKSQEAARIAKEKNDVVLAAQQKQHALASMLVTSGFGFDGHTVTKYSGYISGDDVTQVGRGTSGFLGSGGSEVGNVLTDSLVKIRRNALAELKEAAWALGCNAVIGVDFDYLTLEPESVNMSGNTKYLPYVICVTANGNAVVIEKQNLTALS